jgi:hypothetical protein
VPKRTDSVPGPKKRLISSIYRRYRSSSYGAPSENALRMRRSRRSERDLALDAGFKSVEDYREWRKANELTGPVYDTEAI